jgi:hypothetical protein
MIADDWLAIISRISSFRPLDLEPIVGAHSKVKAVEQNSVPVHYLGGLGTPPSSKLWPKDDASVSYIGVRIEKELSHPTQVAFRLASVALERRVVPIIFATSPDCGFERFGFRVELLSGNSPEDTRASEGELMGTSKNCPDLGAAV